MALTAKREAVGAAKLEEKPKVVATPPTVVKPTPTEVALNLSLSNRNTSTRTGSILERTIAVLKTFNVAFSYDLFRDRYHVGNHALQQRIGELIENAILVLRTTVSQRFDFDPRPDAIKSAVYRLCLENSFNPVRDYLDSVKWDGKPRLDRWLTTYLDAEDNPLNRKIGRKGADRSGAAGEDAGNKV